MFLYTNAHSVISMKKRGDWKYVVFILLIVVTSIVSFKFLAITGHAVNKSDVKFSAHKQHFRFDFADQQSSVVKELKLDDFPDNSVLKSLKVTGKASGFFRVWLVTDKGRFLVVDSHSIKKNELKNGVTAITAYAVKSKKAKNKDGNLGDNDNGKGGNNNGKVKNKDGNSNDNDNGKGNDGNNNDGNNNGGNDNNNNGNNDGNNNNNNNDNNGGDTGDNADDSKDSKDSAVLKNNLETKALFSRAEMERSLEVIYGPSWLTPAEKQQFQRATEPDKIFNTVTFEGVCQGSCSLPDGLTKDAMHLEIELDGAIELKEVSYELENVVTKNVLSSIVSNVKTTLSPPKEAIIPSAVLQQPSITGLAVQEEGFNSNIFLGLAFIAVLVIGMIIFTATRD